MKHSLSRSTFRNGFTIVELLVVIIVISILASITVVAYRSIQKDAAESTVKADLSNLAKQLAITKAKTGCPADASSLPKSDQTTYSNYSCSGQNFCVQANSNKQASVPNYYIDQNGKVTQGTCAVSGGDTGGGDTGGGTTPAVPTPSAPTGVSGSMACTTTGGTYVTASGTISWSTVPSTSVSMYRLYDVSYVTTSNPAVKIAEFTNTATANGTRSTSFTSASWTANNAQTVKIIVRAVNSGGESADSSAVTQYFPPYDC